VLRPAGRECRHNGVVRSPRLTDVSGLRGSRAVRWGLRSVAVLVVASFGFSLVFSPVRDWFSQRSALAAKTAEFEALAEANEQLQKEVDQLSTTEGIRRAARDHLGYVLPGERPVVIGEMPDLPVELPATWPYTLVSSIVAARAADASRGGGGLEPLGP